MTLNNELSAFIWEQWKLKKRITKKNYLLILKDADAYVFEKKENCVHPFASVIGNGETKPYQCLKCGEYL